MLCDGASVSKIYPLPSTPGAVTRGREGGGIEASDALVERFGALGGRRREQLGHGASSAAGKGKGW